MRILTLAAILLGTYSLVPVLSGISVPMSIEAGSLGFLACMAIMCQMVMTDLRKTPESSKESRSIGDREIAFDNPIKLTAKNIKRKPVRIKTEKGTAQKNAPIKPKQAKFDSSNIIPLNRKSISENLSFEVEAMDDDNIESLRAGYSVQKVIGGTCWSPSDGDELKSMVDKGDLVIILNNKAARATDSLNKVRRECLIKETPTYDLDIYQDDFKALTAILNEKRPKIVFISSHSSSKADREALRKHKLLTYVLDAF